jgi:BirA family transcriptional regulator, biotin operon repressor / biotin---[acetyl-CoA-carboxylase] ligase
MRAPLLPPPYRAERLAAGRSAREAACAAAEAGVAEGVLLWSDRSDRLDMALVLRPDRAQGETLPVIFVAALALADALGAFAPPPAPIGFAWPDGILIDGARAGRVSLRCAPSAPEAVPRWAVLGCDVALAAGGAEPGRTPDRTSLADEGFEDFSAAALIEGFARHFLARLARWEAEGFGPVAGEWWRRAQIARSGAGVPIGLDGEGNLRLRDDRGDRIMPLDAALADG